MHNEAGRPLESLKVDGGMTNSDEIMQVYIRFKKRKQYIYVCIISCMLIIDPSRHIGHTSTKTENG